MKLQTKGQLDEKVYNEEYARISNEPESLRWDKSKIETGNLSIEQY